MRALKALPHCGSLHHLDLRWCYRITDVGLASIASLRLLQHLDLSYCKRISDEGLANIASLPYLQCLNLSHCNSITHVAVASVATLQQLQHIDLHWCSITRERLANVVALQHLQRLDFKGLGLEPNFSLEARVAVDNNLDRWKHLRRRIMCSYLMSLQMPRVEVEPSPDSSPLARSLASPASATSKQGSVHNLCHQSCDHQIINNFVAEECWGCSFH